MKDSIMDWELIHDYCTAHSSPNPDILNKVERYTHNNTLSPRMMSGRLQGRFLSMISKMINPEIIVEIGTFTGYATLCLAEGLRENGEIHTYEVNDELEDFLTATFQASEYRKKIKLHIGDALSLLPELDEKIDLAFIDAGKEDYPVYYELVLSQVNTGGLILIDNVLWSGKVLDNDADKTTTVIKELNDKISRDKRVEKILLPLRDGVFMLRKVGG